MDQTQEIIWPLHIKIIHWVLALIILLNIYLFDEGDLIHTVLGYAGAGLVLIRFYFGFKAHDHVSFAHFNLSLKSLKIFFKEHFRKKNPVDYEGHNPLASLVYFLMWFLVIALGVSGWMMGLDRFWGDEALEEVHVYFSHSLTILVVIHLVGVFLDALLFKRKTWMRMIR